MGSSFRVATENCFESIWEAVSVKKASRAWTCWFPRDLQAKNIDLLKSFFSRIDLVFFAFSFKAKSNFCWRLLLSKSELLFRERAYLRAVSPSRCCVPVTRKRRKAEGFIVGILRIVDFFVHININAVQAVHNFFKSFKIHAHAVMNRNFKNVFNGFSQKIQAFVRSPF